MHLPSEDLVDAVAVGDSRWFADAAGCDRALAQHARVATDLTQCEFEPFVPDAVQQATRRSFEELLRRGGVAYAVGGDARVAAADEDGRCEPFNVTPSKRQRAGLLAGALWRETVSHGVREKTSTGYMYLRGGRRVGRNGPDELTRLGHSVTHADGSGYGIGCASTAYVTYGRGVVYADGPLYLTRAACQGRDRRATAPRRVGAGGGRDR
ncbi:MAG: hypothetical protein IPL61_27325 [Myxococcales bacterium]|nr:hypothetical protein [Myxococcales bacterium]